MRIRFDPAKAAVNLRKHDVSFADAEGVLHDPLALTVEDESSEGEQRFVSIGRGSGGDLLVVVWTQTGQDHRLISARRPTRKERKCYEG